MGSGDSWDGDWWWLAAADDAADEENAGVSLF